jgi:hypothetical protein
MQTELHTIVDDALAWCAQALPFFSITRTTDMRVSAKAFAEFLLALNVLHESGYARTPAYDALLALAVDETREFDWEAALAHRSDLLLLAAYLNTFCARNGLPAAIPTDRISAALDEVLPLDAVPYRELDMLCGLAQGGAAVADERFTAALLRSGCLGDGIMNFDDTDLYAATHAFFYATVFGDRTERVSPALRGEMLAAIDLGLDVTLREGHADLVGEYLMCYASLGVPVGRRERSAWRFLTSAQQPNGAVPIYAGAHVRGDDFRTAPDREQWLACYHTTLVAAMAAAMRLARHDG